METAAGASDAMDRPAHHPVDSLTAARIRVYATAAGAFVALAIWGSWFPFAVRQVSLELSMALLRWSINPQQFSLTDALSNLLLFVPIGLFAAPVVAPGGRLRGHVAVVAWCVGLSSLLELGQLLVPWRTPSVLDIAAETAGALAGVMVWRIAGRELDTLVGVIVTAWRRAHVVERALWIYGGAFALAWLLPFDFTLRPDEIGDKYAHQRLLLPWMLSPDAATPMELLLTGLAAIPLGWAAVLCTSDGKTRRSVAAAAADVAALLIALTLLQVAVFSRTTDTTATLVAMAGAAAGAMMAARMTTRRIRVPRYSPAGLAAMAAVWLAAVVMVEWWPFHFQVNADRLEFQIALWSFDPFRAPAAAVDVVPGTLAAIATGALAAPLRHQDYVRLQAMGALFVVGGVFSVIEAGRLLIPGEVPTLTSVAIKLVAFTLTLIAVSARSMALSQVRP
jgi:glycopeptide antibiotics resistance protein/stage V sporulation protein SpoVS